jgi:DNA-binding beta-propeller fold protein YncE
MKRVLCACLAAASLVLGGLRLDAREGMQLKLLGSVYADAKGNGFRLPEGVACDDQGRFIVADSGNGRLVTFTLRDGAIGGGSELQVPQLTAPVRLQLNSKGEIVGLDGKQRRIVILNPDGTFKGVLALDGVPPPAAIVVKAFAIDAADALYVLDVFSGRVLVTDASGKVQRSLPLPVDARFVSDVAVDPSGTVFVIDSVGRKLYAAAKDAGTFTPVGGDLTEFLATMPSFMTISRGVILVAEGPGSSIVTFGRDGVFLSRQLTSGWKEGSLNHPAQICLNSKAEMFVADRDNSRVQVFQAVR